MPNATTQFHHAKSDNLACDANAKFGIHALASHRRAVGQSLRVVDQHWALRISWLIRKEGTILMQFQVSMDTCGIMCDEAQHCSFASQWVVIFAKYICKKI